MSEPETPISKNWVGFPEYGRVEVTVGLGKILVEIADDDVQRHYSKVLPLEEYANEVPTDGWTPLRKIIADDFEPEECAEIEAFIAELRQQ